MIRSAVLCAAVAMMTGSAAAADWPTGPVKVVVPYAAGGAADVMGRVFMDSVGTKLGVQFVIENQGGAGGLLGSRAVARSQPDGMTLVISGMASHVLAPLMSKDPGVDPNRGFTHIGFFGGAPSVLLAHPSTGVRNMTDLLDAARKAKDGLEYLSPGFGTAGHIAAAYLADKERIKLLHVPYKGGGAAIFDVVSGHVKFASMNWSTAREHVANGSLVPIAVTSSSRLAELKDVPTFRELGYPDLVMTTWYSLSGPAGMPQDVVARLNEAVRQSLESPRVKRQLEIEAAEPRALSPAETASFIQSQYDQWKPVTDSLKSKN
ncbi:MAG: extracytoplasmic binding receptor [Hyphomicrobiales bacterium]|nr:extracytoplasmic binding receptor [Hyphomicrobiales bacterium]